MFFFNKFLYKKKLLKINVHAKFNFLDFCQFENFVNILFIPIEPP